MNVRKLDKTFYRRSFRRFVKRFGDILFSLIALIVASPIFVLIALLVKLSSTGPAFYVQERVGRNYRRFGCIKFRTMYSEADDLLLNLLEKSPELKDEFERNFKLRKDPRITPIGVFLRRSSLDELPQFINILIGDMSLVGPRPIVEKEIARYDVMSNDRMDIIVSVRPGLTGLWQVSGRNNLTYHRRVELDLIYVTERSLLLDFKVILRTFGVLLFPRDRGAY